MNHARIVSGPNIHCVIVTLFFAWLSWHMRSFFPMFLWLGFLVLMVPVSLIAYKLRKKNDDPPADRKIG
jgi:hypothetical protein